MCVLVDEVESLAATRQAAASGTEPSDAIRVVNALLTQLDQLKRWFESGLITEAVWHERQRSLLHGGEGGPGGPSTGSDPAHKAAGVAEARGM